MKDYLVAYSDQTLLKLYVQPGASATKLIGFYGDPKRIKVMIKAPPVEGKANKAILEFCAKTFGLSKSKVSLKKGETHRNKDVLLDCPYEKVAQILEILLKKIDKN